MSHRTWNTDHGPLRGLYRDRENGWVFGVCAGIADRFNLSYGGLERFWKLVNPFDGTSLVREAGDFASCAHWGDRNKDLLRNGTQLERCFPPYKRDQRTLVIITSGGNDLSKLTRNAIDGVSEE